jgi:2-desacetyl-2-hydroxyethyl bacteriochlorophyllide A dehydrogenase
LIAKAPNTLAWQEYTDAPLQPGQVRVKSEFSAAKHGTEMAFLKGYAIARGRWNEEWELFEPASEQSGYPFHLGNMYVGKVTAVAPDVKTHRVGERVYAWGSFRETHTVAEGQCFKLPHGLPWQAAVCNDPAHFALGAVRDGHVRPGDAVAIFGMGAIGLVTVQLACRAGATTVIAIDPLPARRALAEKLGASKALDPKTCDVGREIKAATAKRGADVVIDFSGHRTAIQQALRGVAYGGNVVCGSFPAPYDAGLDLGGEAHMNCPNLIFSRACSVHDRDHPRWTWQRVQDTCREIIERGWLRAEEIVTPVVAFDELLEAYPRIAGDPAAGVKLGIVH